ncbi:MAG TPA: glycosyltransferase family 2 protein [Anaerolineales bacterium]|nr:glycosyltransferase family 2 protein [Anaerolineales bacterium]
MKSIAVCIITCNTRDLLRECLRSVLMENPDEIVVVDNASTDGSVDMLKAEFPSVALVTLEKNIGFGAASNRGIQRCRSEHIYLINADTRVKSGSVQALNRYLEFHPEAAMVGPRMLNPDGTLQTSCFYYPTPLHVFLYISGSYKLIPHLPLLKKRSLQKVASDESMAVPWIHGAALAFRRDQIQSVGGFDENFFLYFEEVDLCYRLTLQGQQMHFMPEAEIIHVGGGTTVQRRAWFYIEFFASLAQFYRKHYSTLLLTELVFIVKLVSFFKLARDTMLKPFVRDAAKRSMLEVNLDIHRSLLFGPWHRRSNAGTVVPA